MKKLQVKELVEAGVHFGHLTRKWNPNMSPYVYMEKNGIHIINLYKTVAKLDENNRKLLKPFGLLTRDPRMVERKKFGQKKARKKFQFSKR